MNIPPVSKPFFSEDPVREKIVIITLLVTTLVAVLILALAWQATRTLEFNLALQQWRSAPVELLFRAFTFLGDDQFFMIFFSVLIWCVSKSLGFWSAFMLLSSGIYSNLIKDITMLERPALEGVVHPAGSYAFPSGHTLTAITVWPYLAVRLKKRGYWIWAVAVIVMIGFSRLVLGYHFLGDVIGGVAFGVPFLLLFLWVSAAVYQKGWIDKFSIPLLLVLSIAIPVLLAAVLPGADPPKLLGYLAGASFGYIIEKQRVRASVKATLPLQVMKVLLGVVVLFGIIVGLGGVLPSSVAAFGFIRYGLGGIWVTLFAPALFVYLKLSVKEDTKNIM